jgi:trehalose 6-phosphate phosphatase
MKDVLLPRYRSVFARLLAPADRPPLLAFDYDGVLAPIVRDPEGARMAGDTRARLRELSRRFPVAVVSGRSLALLRRTLGTVAPYLVGNHGAEYLRSAPPPASLLRRVRTWERQVLDALGDAPGVWLEHKRTTFAVHYGHAPDRQGTLRAVLRAARALHGARLVLGKNLVNVLPVAFPTKGDAVRRLLRQLRCRRALFVGDDVTDEDVFALPERLVLGIHVGSGPTVARWRVATRDDVDVLMDRLLELSASRTERHR